MAEVNKKAVTIGLLKTIFDLDTSKPEHYQGAYNVTPAIEPITLETKDKVMTDNVIIHEIPYFETSNDTGTTVIIGG